MVNYKKEINKVKGLPSEEADKILDKLPDGLLIGKKIVINGIEITYEYTEKHKEILRHLFDKDVEKTMEMEIYRDIKEQGY